MDTSYKIVLSYKGTNYRGWQYQTENSPTVQEVFEKVILKIINYKEFSLIAASRTDRGVHASHQVIRLTIPKSTEPNLLTKGLNDKLPSDIRVMHCEIVDRSFNPNTQARLKTYHYYFTPKLQLNASLSEIIYNHPEELNIKEMKRATNLFIGSHDFNNFSVSACVSDSTIRDIISCSLKETNFGPNSSTVYYLEIKAKGYLKYMVRFIMGSLFQVGMGQLSILNLEDHLKNKKTEKISKKAPAHGLHLIEIEY